MSQSDLNSRPNNHKNNQLKPKRTKKLNKELAELLQSSGPLNSKVWLGSKQQKTLSTSDSLDTGYKALNEQLHTEGWPINTSTELGLSQPGIGELRLLIPALRALQQRAHQQQNIIWIAPPFLPYSPGLIKEGIDINKLTVIQTNTIQDTLWAAEQTLLAECCAAVLCWTGTYNLSNRELRRLQLASEKTKTWNVLFRHSDCLKQASASGLRIHLKSDSYSKLELHILKQANGWGGQRCSLSLHPHYENWQRLPTHLLPHHNSVRMDSVRMDSIRADRDHTGRDLTGRKHARVIPEKIETLGSSHQQYASVTVLTPLSAIKTAH